MDKDFLLLYAGLLPLWKMKGSGTGLFRQSFGGMAGYHPDY